VGEGKKPVRNIHWCKNEEKSKNKSFGLCLEILLQSRYTPLRVEEIE